MSDGLNKSFIADPAAFLKAHPFRVDGIHDPQLPDLLGLQTKKGVGDFDLKAKGNGARLVLFKSGLFKNRHRLRAYWLDFELGKTSVCNLDDPTVPFLFTPSLDGCFIGIRNGAICHVAGRNSHGEDRRDSLFLAAQTKLGALTIAFDSNIADAEKMTLVGVSKKGIWSWYLQGSKGKAKGSTVEWFPDVIFASDSELRKAGPQIDAKHLDQSVIQFDAKQSYYVDPNAPQPNTDLKQPEPSVSRSARHSRAIPLD